MLNFPKFFSDLWPTFLKSEFQKMNNSCLFSDSDADFFCSKKIGGISKLVKCVKKISDFRIACLPPNQNLNWYNGEKSKTIDGIDCRRWDEIHPSILDKFHDFFSFQPSKSSSTGIGAHENFCRNPDSWKWGPWCFVDSSTSNLERQPCFFQCQNSTKSPNLCLSRVFLLNPNSENLNDFPERVSKYSSLYSAPKNGTLSQIFSSTFNCFSNEKRGEIFGPWIFAENSAQESNYSNDKWERCYLACEDYALKCSPGNNFTYFGPKKTTIEGRECVAPSLVFDKLQKTAEEYKDEKIMKIKIPVSVLLLKKTTILKKIQRNVKLLNIF